MVVRTSAVPAASPIPTPAFDTAVVRELLVVAFNDGELTTLCFDCFRPVYEQFAEGMNRAQKTHILVEHCERRGRMEELLAKIERANPYQYGRFKARLRNGDPPPDPKPGPKPPSNPFAGTTTVKDPTPAFDTATERELPMAAFIEADRKARFGEKVVEKPEEPPSEPIIDGPIGRKKYRFRFPIIRLPPDYRWKPRLWQTILWLVVAGVLFLATAWVNAVTSDSTTLVIAFGTFFLLVGLIFFRLVWIWWPHKKRS